MAYIYDLSDQWSASGTTFTGIKLNVTDTASAAGSLLMDLQVGGVSQFRVDKSGEARLSSVRMVNSIGNIAAITYDPQSRIVLGSRFAINDGNGDIVIQSGRIFLGTTIASADADVRLFRDAANTLAMRNGVNAQAFNLYNTYTDASNYERGFMRFVGNVLQIGAEAAGTGSARELRFVTGGNSRLRVTTDGTLAIAGTTNVGANLTSEAGFRTGFIGIGYDLAGGSALVIGAAPGTVNIGAWGFSGLIVPSSANFNWASSTNLNIYDTGLARSASSVVRVTNGASGGGAMQLTEMTAPAAPPANNVRIYAEDDGAGKTRLMACFATGAAVQIAIEP